MPAVDGILQAEGRADSPRPTRRPSIRSFAVAHDGRSLASILTSATSYDFDADHFCVELSLVVSFTVTSISVVDDLRVGQM